MKKRKGLRRLICTGFVLAMTVGLSACGKKTISADATLAKEFVYSYQDIALPEIGENVTVNTVTRKDDRVFMVVEGYQWDENGENVQRQIMSMKADGTDIQTVDLEIPVSESSTNVDVPIGGEPVPYDMARTATTLEEEPMENTADDEVISNDVDGVMAVPDDMIGDMVIDDEYYSQTYEYTGYSNYVFGSDDKLYAVKEHTFEDYSDPENYVSTRNNAISAWDMNGKLLWEKPMETIQSEEEYIYISKLVPYEDGSLSILINGDSVTKIDMDADGNVSERKELKNGNDILYNSSEIMVKEDGTLLVPHYNEDWTAMYLTSYDLKNDKIGEDAKLPDSFMWSGYSSLAAGSDTDIVYATSNGIFGYNIGDEQPVQIMSYINSDLNTNSMSRIVMLDETHFIGFYNDIVDYSEKGALFTKRNPEDIPDKQVILLAGVYIPYDMMEHIVDFNKNSEEYRVVVKSYDSYNTMEDYTAGATQLNNDIIAGNMPDIIIADETLPIDSYISKGWIADVGKLIEDDEELSKVEFMENVFDAYSVDEKLYYVLPSFYMNTMVGKTSLLGDRERWTIQEFREFADNLPEGTQAMGEMTRDSFIYYAMMYGGNDFVDVATGKCNFDSEEFIGMLEYANTLPAEFSEDYYGEDYWMTYESQYRENRTVLMPMYISSARDMTYNLNGYFGEDVTFIGFPSEDGNGAVLRADSSFALSSRSANLEGAWQFMRYYLTDEYQESLEWGLPVVKKLFKDSVQEATQKPYYIDENGDKVEYDDYFSLNGESVVLEPLSQKQVDQIVSVVESTKKRQFYDQDIQDIITEEVAAFFEGQKSASEVASLIQNRVNLFVNENR